MTIIRVTPAESGNPHEFDVEVLENNEYFQRMVDVPRNKLDTTIYELKQLSFSLTDWLQGFPEQGPVEIQPISMTSTVMDVHKEDVEGEYATYTIQRAVHYYTIRRNTIKIEGTIHGGFDRKDNTPLPITRNEVLYRLLSDAFSVEPFTEEHYPDTLEGFEAWAEHEEAQEIYKTIEKALLAHRACLKSLDKVRLLFTEQELDDMQEAYSKNSE